MRAFRLLNENEIECRISEINKDGKFLKLLLYKTARTDAALLDETYGEKRWQNDFQTIDGILYGGIGIKFDDEWIWRWDCGTESNMEAEKGQASDAFKRAGFKWGLGAELYTAPQIKIYNDRCNIKTDGGKAKCYDRFSVKSIGYDKSGSICSLEIINESTNDVCYTMGEKIHYQQKPKEEPKKTVDDLEKEISKALPIECSVCHKRFIPSQYDVETYKKKSIEYCGVVACSGCSKVLAKNANN